MRQSHLVSPSPFLSQHISTTIYYIIKTHVIFRHIQSHHDMSQNVTERWHIIEWYVTGHLNRYPAAYHTLTLVRLFQEVWKVFKESVECVSRIFQKKFPWCFKNVSMKFCLSILLLHWSRCSSRAEGGLRNRTVWLAYSVLIYFWFVLFGFS